MPVPRFRIIVAQPVLWAALHVLFLATPATAVTWFALPAASYSPETGVAVGGAAGFYWRVAPLTNPSSVQVLSQVTQKRQFILKLKPELWLSMNRWRAYSELHLLKYPDTFFGIGNDDPVEEDYTAKRAWILLTGQRRISETLRAGPQIAVDYCRLTDVAPGGALASGGVPGAGERTVVGIGGSAAYDTRESIFWPTSGSLVEAGILVYPGIGNTTYRFARMTADARWYRGFARRHVVAVQALFDMAHGEVPFLLLPALGGDDLLRGYREGRHRDDVAAVVQAEYRVKLFWRLSAVAYAGVGRVAGNVADLNFSHLRPAAGIGGRFRMNNEGVNIRADLAFGRGDRGLYITATEAF